ncbi:hypothetical protein NCS52_00575000 [Fusarium sp. LHS14.1]|nr:hypothetical protein NCS52_00575000 [Fusarium sp. LHS14.1]
MSTCCLFLMLLSMLIKMGVEPVLFRESHQHFFSQFSKYIEYFLFASTYNMPVQKSDVLTIPGEGEWKITPVAWTQSLKEFREDYLCIEFTNTRADEPEKTGFLYVSQEFLDKFKSSKIERTDTGFKLTVDNDYVYGQQKGNNYRFLVYHDKRRSILQHRFVEGNLAAISKRATEITTKLGYGDARVTSQMLAGFIGEKLRDFERD